MVFAKNASDALISIHALRVEGDGYTDGVRQISVSHFYPRPPGGGRQATSRRCSKIRDFYPRPPGGGRPCKDVAVFEGRRDFYPRPPGGGRPRRSPRDNPTRPPISIHALRVEGDRPLSVSSRYRARISIHALRVEGDVLRLGGSCPHPRISIHALRVEGDFATQEEGEEMSISIHALRVEGDLRFHAGFSSVFSYFYPRPPGGGRPETLKPSSVT